MNHLRNIASVILILLVIGMLAACGATAPTIQEVPTAIPVACKEAEPARPVMPCDLLIPGATVDDWVRCSSAEIKRREGYEGKLVTALRACIAPIQP